MEERLGGLEHLASRIWPALSTQLLDLTCPNVRRCIALVVATSHLRHPRTLEVIEQQFAELLRETEQRLPRPKEEPALSGCEKEVGANGQVGALREDLLRLRGMSENDKHWLFLVAIQRNAMRIAEGLIKKRWSIVVSDTPLFMTSDSPVHAIGSSGQTVGPLTPGAIITFPVSPSRILLMDDKHHEPANQYYPVKGDTPAAQTFWQMRNAARFVFSSFPIDPALARMVGAFPPNR